MSGHLEVFSRFELGRGDIIVVKLDLQVGTERGEQDTGGLVTPTFLVYLGSFWPIVGR